MPVEVLRKQPTMRQLNPGYFADDDPRGDEPSPLIEIVLKSGQQKIATIDVSLCHREHIREGKPPVHVGDIATVRLRAVWVKKRDYYHPGYGGRHEGDWFRSVDDVIALFIREWEEWVGFAGLMEKPS